MRCVPRVPGAAATQERKNLKKREFVLASVAVRWTRITLRSPLASRMRPPHLPSISGETRYAAARGLPGAGTGCASITLIDAVIVTAAGPVRWSRHIHRDDSA